MLVHSPTFLFLIPGALVALAGLVGLCVLASLPRLSDNWTGVSVGCAILLILGSGIVQLGLFSRTYAVIYLGEHDEALERGWRSLRLEHGLALSAAVLLAGAGITLGSFFDQVKDPRLGILGLALVAVGAQGAFASFFLSILGLSRHAILRRQGPSAE